MGWKRHYEKTNPVCSSRLWRASAFVSFWLSAPCCVVSCDLLDGRRDGGLKDAWIRGWRRREQERESPSGESVIIRAERHALRRADKKTVTRVERKSERNKYIESNEKAHGEGDASDMQIPLHTLWRVRRVGRWRESCYATGAARTVAATRLMSLSLLVLDMSTVAQEAQNTLL